MAQLVLRDLGEFGRRCREEKDTDIWKRQVGERYGGNDNGFHLDLSYDFASFFKISLTLSLLFLPRGTFSFWQDLGTQQPHFRPTLFGWAFAHIWMFYWETLLGISSLCAE